MIFYYFQGVIAFVLYRAKTIWLAMAYIIHGFTDVYFH